jgi:hypothetical protein
MVPDVVTKGRGKGKGKGKAAAAAAAADDDAEEVDALAGDAEGGAALAEEAAAPTTQVRSDTTTIPSLPQACPGADMTVVCVAAAN